MKELYYYLDCTPTHSYMKGLYKYPQREFPYADLEAENKRRGVWESEYEILDTGECIGNGSMNQAGDSGFTFKNTNVRVLE